MNSRQWYLALVFLKVFLRDRQSILFNLLMPVLFLVVFGFVNDRTRDPINISLVNLADSPAAAEFVELLNRNPLFSVTTRTEPKARQLLTTADTTLVLIIPAEFDSHTQPTELVVLVDAAQVRQLGFIVPVLEKALISVERGFRQTEPMFTIRLEDVKGRSRRYIDFLLPGLLAFMLMQISIAGSGYNIVEYRRKGILKRLFVTPIRPGDFIASIVGARMLLCILQLTVLLGIAVFVLDVVVQGNLAALYTMMILGTVIFLCMGFCVGSLAKTQQAVGVIGTLITLPQLFLSGVFFPIEMMPGALQPVAQLLPLSYVVSSLRDIANNGMSLMEIMPTILGVLAWILICFLAATRLFVWKEVVD
jgi:ABC-2 type transport system permease protein